MVLEDSADILISYWLMRVWYYENIGWDETCSGLLQWILLLSKNKLEIDRHGVTLSIRTGSLLVIGILENHT